MTDIEIMQALQDAHVILHRLACQAASGTNAVWTILNHAQKHINHQMSDLLVDASEQVVA